MYLCTRIEWTCLHAHLSRSKHDPWAVTNCWDQHKDQALDDADVPSDQKPLGKVALHTQKNMDLKDDFPSGGQGIFWVSSYIKLLGTAKSWEVQNFGTAALPTTPIPAYFRAAKISGANLRGAIKKWQSPGFVPDIPMFLGD